MSHDVNHPTSAERLVDRIDEIATTLWSEIESLADLVEAALGGGEVRRADLAIEGRARDLIQSGGGRVAGAGFVAAPDVLADAAYWLEWWVAVGAEGGGCRRLAAETDPTSLGFRDYTELPWYATPFATGGRHVTGPYVDYLCTDQHALTFTRPVWRDGEFAGVVGVDVLAAWLDRTLAPELAACTDSTIVINASGRVVVASDPDWVVGDLVRDLPLGQWFGTPARSAGGGWGFAECASVPLGVLVRR